MAREIASRKNSLVVFPDGVLDDIAQHLGGIREWRSLGKGDRVPNGNFHLLADPLVGEGGQNAFGFEPRGESSNRAVRLRIGQFLRASRFACGGGVRRKS